MVLRNYKKEHIVMNKNELLKKKKDLQNRLEKIRKDLSSKLDPDFSEQAVQLENREVLLEIQRVTQEELQKINLQLQDK
jgi:RNA polymerase-binding transcription factor DksA